MQNRNLLAWRENHHLQRAGGSQNEGGTEASLYRPAAEVDEAPSVRRLCAPREPLLLLHQTAEVRSSATCIASAPPPLSQSRSRITLSRESDENRPPLNHLQVAPEGASGARKAPPLPYPRHREGPQAGTREGMQHLQSSSVAGYEPKSASGRHSCPGNSGSLAPTEARPLAFISSSRRRRTMPMTPDLVSLDQIIADLSSAGGG
jgi:hypothetical protein